MYYTRTECIRSPFHTIAQPYGLSLWDQACSIKSSFGDQPYILVNPYLQSHFFELINCILWCILFLEQASGKCGGTLGWLQEFFVECCLCVMDKDGSDILWLSCCNPFPKHLIICHRSSQYASLHIDPPLEFSTSSKHV